MPSALNLFVIAKMFLKIRAKNIKNLCLYFLLLIWSHYFSPITFGNDGKENIIGIFSAQFYTFVQKL